MPPTTSPTFSESADALDEILEQFKSGNLKLEEALALFEDGVKHLKNCQSTLAQTKGKVEVLLKDLQSDEPIVDELDVDDE